MTKKPTFTANEAIQFLELVQSHGTNMYQDIPRLKSVLDYVFRAYMPHQPIFGYSEQAKKEFDSLQTNLPIEDVIWANQTKFDYRRRIFHLEHANPVGTLLDRIFLKGENVRKVFEDCIVILITKAENKELNKKYKSTRPGGWQLCYKKCRISVTKV